PVVSSRPGRPHPPLGQVGANVEAGGGAPTEPSGASHDHGRPPGKAPAGRPPHRYGGQPAEPPRGGQPVQRDRPHRGRRRRRRSPPMMASLPLYHLLANPVSVRAETPGEGGWGGEGWGWVGKASKIAWLVPT